MASADNQPAGVSLGEMIKSLNAPSSEELLQSKCARDFADLESFLSREVRLLIMKHHVTLHVDSQGKRSDRGFRMKEIEMLMGIVIMRIVLSVDTTQDIEEMAKNFSGLFNTHLMSVLTRTKQQKGNTGNDN